jgi:hypothetical protein
MVMKKMISMLICFLLVGCQVSNPEKGSKKAFRFINEKGMTLSTRFRTPEGYKRKKSALGDFLADYPLKKSGSPVLLYNGKRRLNQGGHVAVFKLPIEKYDLQQCADSVMRVYIEYYWHTNQKDKIAFHFVDGFLCDYNHWKEGYRVRFNNNKSTWVKSASYDDSYSNLKKYMRVLFAYASTLSLKEESQPTTLSDLKVGDIFIKAGSPGHVVMVVDVCEKNGKKAFLLAQGFMPAQEFHVINNPAHSDDPWYYEEEVTYPFMTMEYTFSKGSLRKLI